MRAARAPREAGSSFRRRSPWSRKPPCPPAARGRARPGEGAPSSAVRRSPGELRSNGIWVYSSLVAQSANAAWESNRHSEKRLPTIQQLVRLGRRAARAKSKAPALRGSPQRRGAPGRVDTQTPKKPDSAAPKAAPGRPTTRTHVTAHLPGLSDDQQEHR